MTNTAHAMRDSLWDPVVWTNLESAAAMLERDALYGPDAYAECVGAIGMPPCVQRQRVHSEPGCQRTRLPPRDCKRAQDMPVRQLPHPESGFWLYHELSRLAITPPMHCNGDEQGCGVPHYRS